MKNLNLLKANLVTGFLNNGIGEKVEYLRVPSELTLEALEEDVAAGAIAQKEILEGAKKGLSRVILIQSDNKEHALMAVNYLAGICNEEEGIFEEEDDDFESVVTDEFDVDAILAEAGLDDEDDDCDEGITTEWIESPSRVPVIPIEELLRYANATQEFRDAGFVSIGLPNMRVKKPYWAECTHEAVCIYAENPDFMFNAYAQISMVMDRFINNKHVFVIVKESENVFGEDVFNSLEHQESACLEFVLQHTADFFHAKAKEDDLKSYRIIQFENWAERLNMPLTKRFPKEEITEKILSIKNPQKSLMIEKVLRYVMKEAKKDIEEEYTQDDFAVLKKFKALIADDTKEKKNANKLEKELIGMESVKEQVRNIVNIMKYNKLREKMGLGKACYHNAHLLIGAPGTAKTTVAQLMGAMMFEENLLPGDRFICVNGADLKGMYVGHSAPKTHAIFENHDVILIDEAYSLTASDRMGGMDTYSQEAIAQLILEIENHPMDKLVMFAGYGGINVSSKNNKMKQFIDANPGLKSRINSTIYFDSYTASQMVDIVHTQATNQKLEVSPDANAAILEYFEKRVADDNFGNGREARSLVENALIYTAQRIMNLPKRKRTKKVMNIITKEDVEKAIAKMKENDKMQTGKQKQLTGFAS